MAQWILNARGYTHPWAELLDLHIQVESLDSPFYGELQGRWCLEIQQEVPGFHVWDLLESHIAYRERLRGVVLTGKNIEEALQDATEILMNVVLDLANAALNKNLENFKRIRS